MKLNVYSIFDSAAGAYTRPFYTQADAQALRMFTDIALDADNDIGKHPEDYSLVRCGVWNDQDAQFTPEAVETLATANEVIAASRKVSKPAQGS